MKLRHEHWDPAFLAYVQQLEKKKPVIFCGDLNVAHTELDLANPKPNRGKKGFTDEEREGFQNFVDAGFVDTFRLFTQGNGHYSWWSHFANSRARNVGWRIDYVLVSASIKSKVKEAKIHADVDGIGPLSGQHRSGALGEDVHEGIRERRARRGSRAVATPATAAGSDCEPQVLADVTLKVQPNGQVLLPASVRGKDVWFELDVGSGLPMVRASAIKAIGLDVAPRRGGPNLWWKGRPVTHYAKLEKMRIGELNLVDRGAFVEEEADDAAPPSSTTSRSSASWGRLSFRRSTRSCSCRNDG